MLSLIDKRYLKSQVARSKRPQYPKVDHYWFKVAHNYEPLALQVSLETMLALPDVQFLVSREAKGFGSLFIAVVKPGPAILAVLKGHQSQFRYCLW